MKYLKLFEKFNEDLFSEVENLFHILQDEGHEVDIRKDIKSHLWISVKVFGPNFKPNY